MAYPNRWGATRRRMPKEMCPWTLWRECAGVCGDGAQVAYRVLLMASMPMMVQSPFHAYVRMVILATGWCCIVTVHTVIVEDWCEYVFNNVPLPLFWLTR